VADAGRRLRELEAECGRLCHEYGWLSPAGKPNYRLIHSHPSTFQTGAGLMLLAIHPRGDSSLADVQTAELPYARPSYTALLDEAWGEAEPGGQQLQTVAREIAGWFGDGEEVLRHAPAGNMIPFRAESIARLPDPLRKHGLSLGSRLAGIVRPRVLVLLGGDRVLFRMAVSSLPGRPVDSMEATFGATRRAYRDVFMSSDELSTFAAVVPLHAVEESLRVLHDRLEGRGLIVGR
jgi:hypothetical protein